MRKNLQFFIWVMLIFHSIGFAQNVRVTGKVTGPDNDVLPDVNVIVKGAQTGRYNRCQR